MGGCLKRLKVQQEVGTRSVGKQRHFSFTDSLFPVKNSSAEAANFPKFDRDLNKNKTQSFCNVQLKPPQHEIASMQTFHTCKALLTITGVNFKGARRWPPVPPGDSGPSLNAACGPTTVATESSCPLRWRRWRRWRRFAARLGLPTLKAFLITGAICFLSNLTPL